MSKEDTTGLGGLDEIARRLSGLFDHLIELKDADVGRHGRREKNGMVFEYSFGKRTVEEARNARGDRPQAEEPPSAAPRRAAKPSGISILEPVTDVFDEPDELLLLFEVPGAARKDIRCVLDGDILLVEAAAGERLYRKEMLIEQPLEAGEPNLALRNGVLQVRLKKLKQTRSKASAKTKRS